MLSHLQLVPISDRRLLLVLVTKSGAVRQSVLDLDKPIAPDALYTVSRIISSELEGCPMSRLPAELTRLAQGGEEDIRQGLCRVMWPGRFQIIRRAPLFLIDGGHNPQCIQALAQNIADYLPNRPLTVLTGVLSDKDYHCMYRSVADHAVEFITVTPDNPRALTAQELAKYLVSFGKPVTPCDTVADGVRLAIDHAGKDGTVLCYGSLYLLGDVINAVEETK